LGNERADPAHFVLGITFDIGSPYGSNGLGHVLLHLFWRDLRPLLSDPIQYLEAGFLLGDRPLVRPAGFLRFPSHLARLTAERGDGGCT